MYRRQIAGKTKDPRPAKTARLTPIDGLTDPGIDHPAHADTGQILAQRRGIEVSGERAYNSPH